METELEGRGIGCVAYYAKIKAGSHILREKPLLYVDPSLEMGTKKHIQAIWRAFESLPKQSKEDYLSLSLIDYNAQDSTWLHLGEEVNIILPEWKGSQKRVFKIYSNNAFGNGVFLKMSRFNHACKPNAEAFWNEETGITDLVAIRSIQPGDEITISYLGMHCQDRDERRSILEKGWGFRCMCSACDVPGDEVVKNKEICKEFLATTLMGKELSETYNAESNICVYQSHVNNMKTMYKLAKQMGTLKIGKILFILDAGFKLASNGAIIWRGLSISQVFLQDANSFIDTAIIISKRLFGESHETNKWQQRKEEMKSMKWTSAPPPQRSRRWSPQVPRIQ